MPWFGGQQDLASPSQNIVYAASLVVSAMGRQANKLRARRRRLWGGVNSSAIPAIADGTRW
jgi:hypothetical protein